MSKPDGGPAFPRNRETRMTLRDAASLAVLQGSHASDEPGEEWQPELRAAYCWKMADAWLAAREES